MEKKWKLLHLGLILGGLESWDLWPNMENQLNCIYEGFYR